MVGKLYGALGAATCLFFNVHVASSITSQARSSISAATLQFEMILSNSVKFSSLNDAITYIYNIIEEKPNRKYNDKLILDRDVTAQECWGQLAKTCGFEWIPTEDDLVILWNIVNQLDQEDLNRLYYKNNLFMFMENKSMTYAITKILSTLETPFLDPNHPPKEILPELEEFLSLIKEYVYYSHQIIDRIDRMVNMIKSVTMISDTDSAIINLDGWYHFILNKIKGKKMKIAMNYYEPIVPVEYDEFGDFSKLTSIDMLSDEYELDYDFYTEETRVIERSINPIVVVPQDGVRYSIINIIAYCLTDIVNDYMAKYCELNHSSINNPSKKCRLYLKNEFLFKTVLLTWVKKHYATIQELREGHNNNNKMDIKGLEINKTTLNKAVQDEMKNILFEDILNSDDIDQVKILKHLAILEKKIVNSINSGSKDFFKPVSIKPMNKYENPMGIQGIKASVVWNYVKGEYIGINLEERNNIDIAKVVINRANVEKIKETNPDIYEGLINCMNSNKTFKNGIDAIAIPRTVEVPEWLIEFIDTTTIANDNMSAFPFESVGLTRMNAAKNNAVNYTNILSL